MRTVVPYSTKTIGNKGFTVLAVRVVLDRPAPRRVTFFEMRVCPLMVSAAIGMTAPAGAASTAACTVV
jgi:hypothetical protein